MPAAFLPSPTRAVWHLGPLPVRAYALCMVGGIVLGVWVASLATLAAFRDPGRAGKYAPVAQSACNLRAIAGRADGG